ncbi:N-acetylneuraminate synthase [Sulfuricurvum kujiense DSM 16994]|uniref:Pseudaminic acid synthase n=1 Tax=Sulfuricurvum kujiense (strain ATCC BAA-921 / DSM 16994 / JCM 11577 / YK-1) TaxID=709032 RepID=E4TXC5_SULKY|nr:pseudaminic acid synthase [Sulfuricurvum kujiense]ADR32822.1 N-acetylneuraminate synthase [Sulfuricurvum kujiense DSM 16994]
MNIAHHNTDEKVFIIAELSANHNGSLDTALRTITAMKDAGADAVKLQTYTPDTITLDCDSEMFTISQGTLWDKRKFHDLYAEAMTPWEWHPILFDHAKSLGMAAFSSPFDVSAVDFLESLDVPAYKIASFEITDIPLIEYTAAKGKPIIISTGIATLSDIEEALDACRRVGNEQIMLLKCTSAYPAALEEMNLLTIADMKIRFGVNVGLSDHTMSLAAPIAAVALGARVIEKHFILDRGMGGADSAFSLEPHEFKMMVDAVRDTEKLLGKVTYELSPKSLKSREFSRSLFIAEDVKEGEVISDKNVRSVRPGFGLAPKHLKEILGKTFKAGAIKGTPLSWDHIG